MKESSIIVNISFAESAGKETIEETKETVINEILDILDKYNKTGLIDASSVHIKDRTRRTQPKEPKKPVIQSKNEETALIKIQEAELTPATRIEEMPLTTRVKNILLRNGIYRIEDLQYTAEWDLTYRILGMGPQGKNQMLAIAKKCGFTLGSRKSEMTIPCKSDRIVLKYKSFEKSQKYDLPAGAVLMVDKIEETRILPIIECKLKTGNTSYLFRLSLSEIKEILKWDRWMKKETMNGNN